MLSKDENELLTRTGPGTPMGNLLRRYWTPALLSRELPEADGNPVRITIMGESLVAFRNSSGAVGLVGNHCPHRGASLYFGRNEEDGLRCVYHGWKFDVAGNCMDMPNEPPESNFKDKIHHTAYPCVDRGGVIWTYMGEPGRQPQLPELEWSLVPESHAYVSKRIQLTNYAQAMEGGIDSSHVSFLHKDQANRARAIQRDASSVATQYLARDGSPKFEVVNTDYGMLIGARRDAEEDSHYWRITQWLYPWYTMIPPFGDVPIGGHAWVPIDDEHCWTYSVNWHPSRPLTKLERSEMANGKGIHAEKIPGTFIPVRNRDNDYQIDRELQRSGLSFTGIQGISEQDTAVQEGMGAIYDRSNERLGAADAAIIQMRRNLMKAARELEQGIEPPGLNASSYRVRSVSVVLPRDVVSWPEAAREAISTEAGKFFVSVA